MKETLGTVVSQCQSAVLPQRPTIDRAYKNCEGFFTVLQQNADSEYGHIRRLAIRLHPVPEGLSGVRRP